MFSKAKFGQRLLETRKANQKTQADLAALLDMSANRISEMEAGKSTTTIENFALICEYYHISADYLLGLSDEPEPSPPPDPAHKFIISLDEFQDFAETNEGLWELIDGSPVKMEPEDNAHRWLCAQLIAQFTACFVRKSCTALPQKDMWASSEELTGSRDKRRDATRKPDLLVYSGKEQSVQNVIVKPELVVEVWSPHDSSTKRTARQALYQALGVKELWLIDSVTGEFSILSFENLRLPKVSTGQLEKDRLCSFLFPDLCVDLSGLTEFLQNFSAQN